MGRPAGSKNKKIEEIISEVEELGLDSKETMDVVHELEDLLEPVEEVKKKLVGYHPVTGVEIWE